MDKKEALEFYFHYKEFRFNQEEIIDSLIEKNDTLAILATGGGKSICFQIPALLTEGLTIVITPLISLMQNQVDELKQRGIKAEFLISDMDFLEVKRVIDNLIKGEIKFLYISPERLENERHNAIFLTLDISYIIIDEAHCISIWGNDFRPSYRYISTFINKLPIRPTIGAFTATANKKVIKDIEDILHLIDLNIYRSSFDRPNLFYGVYKPKNKFDFLVKYLLKFPEEIIIIYTITRKDATVIYNKLKKLNFNVGIYHGGLTIEEKELCQQKFMDESIKIIVATNAFGMGINKPNIRHVINYCLPLSLEDLSQQSGRCSRDGNEGNCILLFNEEDIKTCEFFIKQTKGYTPSVNKELIKEKYKQLKSVIEYATTKKCLHHTLVSYFNQMSKTKCYNCTSCKKKK